MSGVASTMGKEDRGLDGARCFEGGSRVADEGQRTGWCARQAGLVGARGSRRTLRLVVASSLLPLTQLAPDSTKEHLATVH